MKIHEYQAKGLLARQGIPVPQGQVAASATEAGQIARTLGGRVVVKAQVLVGGRGKAGGIKVVDTPEAAESAAGEVLAMRIKGLPVRKVLVEQACDIASEYYASITVDRAARRNVAILSRAGGIDIEEVAATTPEMIAKAHIDPAVGLRPYMARALAADAGVPREQWGRIERVLCALYEAYIANDASLAEINPLVMTAEGALIAADAKMIIDDNALFRQKALAELREEEEDDPLEAEAHRRGLAYVRLDGDIGIVGNGAGLVMTTLDVVQRAGGRPANFLDIGGGARSDLVESALDMVLTDPNVRGVLVVIFGGITRCDEVARGLIRTMAERKLDLPIVVHLTGTREEEGRALLAGSPVVPADSLEEAADKMARLVESRTQAA